MMTFKEKERKCKEFFYNLKKELEGSHEFYRAGNSASFHKRTDYYLIPKGSNLSYYGHPENSIRMSNHWSWYTSTSICSNPNYVQCLNKDLPRPKRRPSPDEESTPIMGIQIGVCGKDGIYRCLYGEKYNNETRKWEWVESDPEYVAIALTYQPAVVNQ